MVVGNFLVSNYVFMKSLCPFCSGLGMIPDYLNNLELKCTFCNGLGVVYDSKLVPLQNDIDNASLLEIIERRFKVGNNKG